MFHELPPLQDGLTAVFAESLSPHDETRSNPLANVKVPRSAIQIAISMAKNPGIAWGQQRRGNARQFDVVEFAIPRDVHKTHRPH
jgi:hypothetical protein